MISLKKPIDHQTEIKITNQVLAMLVVVLALALGIAVGKQKSWLKNPTQSSAETRSFSGQSIPLEKPNLTQKTPLNQTIKARQVRYQFTDNPITLSDLSQLLWAMQGVTTDWGDRAAPSIRSAYPLKLTIMATNVSGLSPGLYVYDPEGQFLKPLVNFDIAKIQNLFSPITSLEQAAAVIMISADQTVLAEKYEGQNKPELTYLEAGHAAQNLMLEAQALGLGVNPIAQFNDLLSVYFQIPEAETAIYLLPVGYPILQ